MTPTIEDAERVWREMPEDVFPNGFEFVKTPWGGYWRSLRAKARAKVLGEQWAAEALADIRKALDRMKLPTTTELALRYLAKHGPSVAADVGTVISVRRGRISSVNGGGDYAAQMLLGRLKKRGFVQRATARDDERATRWELTSAGWLSVRR